MMVVPESMIVRPSDPVPEDAVAPKPILRNASVRSRSGAGHARERSSLSRAQSPAPALSLRTAGTTGAARYAWNSRQCSGT